MYLSKARRKTYGKRHFLYSAISFLACTKVVWVKKCGVVCAMLLGEKSFLDVEVKSLYQLNGIGHILAISGLHVSILCAFWVGFYSV